MGGAYHGWSDQLAYGIRVPGSKFTEQKGELSWAAEHVVGVGKSFGEGVPAEVQKEILDGLNANFTGECTEVGMYLAMARVAYREGYPEIGEYWRRAASGRGRARRQVR